MLETRPTFAEERRQALTGADPARVWLPIDEAKPERAFVAGVFREGALGIFPEVPNLTGLAVRVSGQVGSAWVARVCQALSELPRVKLAGEVYRAGIRNLEVHLATGRVRAAEELAAIRRAQQQATAAVVGLLSSELRKLP